MSRKPSKITTMRFSVELLRRIEKVARRDGMSRSAVVNRFVVAGLEQCEQARFKIETTSRYLSPTLPSAPRGALDC